MPATSSKATQSEELKQGRKQFTKTDVRIWDRNIKDYFKYIYIFKTASRNMEDIKIPKTIEMKTVSKMKNI